MKKSLWIILGIIGVLLVLVVVVPMLISWNQYKTLIEDKATAAAGRQITINGDVRFGLLPTPFARITDVVVANPPGTTSKEFATVKSIDIKLALAPLLTKKIQVTHIIIDSPAATLETMANGQNNWQFGTADKTKPDTQADETADSDDASPSALSIDDLTIKNGYIRQVDDTKKSVQTIGPFDGTFQIASLNGPMNGHGTITVLDKLPIAFTASVDSLPKKKNGVIPFAIDAKIMDDAALASIKGQIKQGKTTGVHADIAIAINKLQQIMGALSKDGKNPSLPAFLTKKTDVNGVFDWGNDRAILNNLTVAADGMEAAGTLTADLKDQTTVTLDIAQIVLPPSTAAITPSKTDLLDTAKASGPTLAQQLQGGFNQAVGLLDTALPAKKLNVIITANQLNLPAKPAMRDVRVAASFAQSGATIQNIEAKMPGNTFIQLNGQLPTRGDGKIASATITASINSQSIEAALGKATTKPTPLNAKTTMVLTRDDLRLQPLQIIQNNQTVQGDIVYNPKSADALSVAVKGGALNLDAFMGGSAPVAEKAPSTTQPAEQKDAAPSDPLGAMQGLKAKVTVALDSLIYKGKTAKKVAIDAVVSDAGLQLGQASIADLGGATVQATGRIGKFNPLSDVDLDAKAATPNLSQTLRALGNTAAQNLGAANFDAQIKGDEGNLKLTANGTVDQGKLSVDALAKQLNSTPTFSGTIDIAHPETATIMRNFAGLTPSGNLGPFALKTEFAYGTNILKAHDLTVRLGSAGTLTGEINILPQGESRSIDATLKADKLALSVLTGEAVETTPQQVAAKPVTPASKGWPHEPINLGFLRNLNGQANIAIGELLYKKFDIKNFKTAVKFANNSMTLSDFSGSLFDAGNFAVNGQLQPGAAGQAHRGDFAVTVKDADAKKLFEAMGSKPFSEGKVDLNQKIAFNGASQYDIIKSLNGDGTVQVTNGVINGINLDGLAAKLDRPNSLSDFAAIVDQARAGGQTTIGNLTVPVAIKDGIASISNVAIKTQKTQMGLNGSVNLPEKTVDMTGSIAFVEQKNLPPLNLLITGPMDSPNKKFDTRSFTSFYAQKLTGKLGGKLGKLLGLPEAPATTPAAPAIPAAAPAVTTTPSTTEVPAVAPAATPDATAPAPKKKKNDALKQMGGQMLQNFLGGSK